MATRGCTSSSTSREAQVRLVECTGITGTPAFLASYRSSALTHQEFASAFCWAAVVVEVNTWRWAGVPFRLRAGKALRELDKRVVITFKEPKMGPRGPPGLRAARPAAYRPGPRGAAVRLQYQRARRSSNCRAGRDGIEPRAGETYRPRGRYSPVIRRSPYEVTRPCRPGGSLSRCCGPGATTPYRWRSTGPAVTARASTLKVE
jgi:hypothetical protein